MPHSSRWQRWTSRRGPSGVMAAKWETAMSQAGNRQLDAHLQHGKRLHGAGRLAEAAQVYRQVLTVAPEHAEARDMMGVLLLQASQPAEALEWLLRAIAIN